jgi:hypothetical protein
LLEIVRRLCVCPAGKHTNDEHLKWKYLAAAG